MTTASAETAPTSKMPRELWADRVVASSLAEQAVDYGLSNPDELEAIAAAWRDWLEHDDGFFVVVHAELIARR